MIATESFKRFRLLDIFATTILAGIWAITIILLKDTLLPHVLFIISILLGALLMAFSVHLIRKAGSATLFYAISALLTFNLDDLGPIGINKFIVLILAGIIFELFFLILKLEIKSIQVDIILGAAISSASIPILTAFILAGSSAFSQLTPILNLSLLSFFLGLAGSVISFLIWFNIKIKKLILKFEYY